MGRSVYATRGWSHSSPSVRSSYVDHPALFMPAAAPARFDAFVFDELHRAQRPGLRAGGRHVPAVPPARPALGLTGSLFNGYADSVFLILLAFCRPIWDEFGFHDRGRFALRYGLFKLLKDLTNQDGGPRLRERGKASLRTEYSEDPILRTLGPAPGFLPALVADYMLGVSAILTQDDLNIDLPPLDERRIALTVAPADAPGQGLLTRLSPLEDALRQQIGTDRWDPERRGKLLGALVELPSYLVLGTADVGNGVDRDGRRHYHVRYPGAARWSRPATSCPRGSCCPRSAGSWGNWPTSWSAGAMCSSTCATPAMRPSSPACAA